MKAICAALITGGALISCLEAADINVSFEAEEGFVEGSLPISEIWAQESDSTTLIDVAGPAAGTQSLKIERGAVVFSPQSLPNNGVRFVDVFVRPIAQTGSDLEVAISAFGSSIGFAGSSSGVLNVAAVNGQNPAKVVVVGNDLGPNGQVDDWLRLTFRQNLADRKWDLFVDGELKAIDLVMDQESLDQATFFGNDAAPISIDELKLTAENPLFADIDKDGMPDAEEFALGLNSHANDRDGDQDSDGVSNIEEFLNGTSPAVPGELVPNSILYVDNLNGNDGNSGKRSYSKAGDGPMFSVKSAMDAAQSGDTIVIMKGKGVYEEGSRGIGNKKIIIKAVSVLTIK